MSTSPLPAPVSASAAGHVDGPARLTVIDMACSLDFYLALGCEVRCAADGWVLLAHGARTLFVFTVAAPGPGWRARSQPHRQPGGSTPQIRLSTPDLRALRRRLLTTGIPVGAIIRPVHAPDGEFEVSDPDQHLVVIDSSEPAETLSRNHSATPLRRH